VVHFVATIVANHQQQKLAGHVRTLCGATDKSYKDFYLSFLYKSEPLNILK
jgi:hypothetical protein